MPKNLTAIRGAGGAVGFGIYLRDRALDCFAAASPLRPKRPFFLMTGNELIDYRSQKRLPWLGSFGRGAPLAITAN